MLGPLKFGFLRGIQTSIFFCGVIVPGMFLVPLMVKEGLKGRWALVLGASK